MPLITVYTATYNREKLLNRVYESLLRQTSKNFLWLIVDDGSTDGTKEYIHSLMKDSPIEIRYYYKENGGIHTARDAAYRICDTELIVGVDSDDWMTDDAIEKIEKVWTERSQQDAIGVIAKSQYSDGTVITSDFPEGLEYSNYQDFKYKYHVGGDMVNIFKTEPMKQTKDAPVFPGEKLVGEDYKSIQLPDKPFMMLDAAVKNVEYQNNGYTADVYNCMFNNPHGFREDYKQHIISSRYFKPKFRGYIGYVSCCILIKDGTMISQAPCKWKMILMAPIGFMGFIGLKFRRHMRNKSRIKSE